MHVLVATDGSEHAPVVAQRGLSLLGSADQVTLLTVITKARIYLDDEEFTEPDAPLDTQERLWQSQIDDAKAAIARTAGPLKLTRVDERIEAGDAGPTICDVARELGVDALVIGSRGRQRRGPFHHNSVTDHVVHHAPCAVLVVSNDAA
jgi:nucleotide-binding universal stress UspA family protein